MNYFKTFALIAVLTTLFMFIGYSLGGTNGAMIALVIAGFMNFMAYWNSDKIVLKMTKASIADRNTYKAFYDIVEKQVVKANMPMPKLYVMHEAMPNAFATGRNPKNSAVAITEGIWQLLSKEELAGVIAHELAHIKNRDTLISTITATFAGAISMIANMFMFMNLFGGGGGNRPHPIVGIIIMLIAPITAAIIQMAVSRQREYAADKLGGEICENPLYLASALEKLEMASRRGVPQNKNEATAHMYIINPFSARKKDALFSTHPNTQNRISELKKQADRLGIVSFIPTRLSSGASIFDREDNNPFASMYNKRREEQRDAFKTEKPKKKEYIDKDVPNNPWL